MVNDSRDVKWVTINGAHIPLKNGETPQDYFNKKSKHIKRRYGLNKYAFEENPDYKPFDDDIILEFSDNELQKAMDDQIGDLNDYSYDKHTDYNEFKEKCLKVIKEITGDENPRINEYVDFYNKSVGKILQHKANEFLKTMPKLQDKTSENIMFGTNRNNYLWSVSQSNNADYDKYTSNCQRCVQAWFLRHLGYDVEALPYEGNRESFGYADGSPNDKISRWGWTEAIFCRSTVTTSFEGKPKQWASSQLKEIKDIATKDGPGACYFLSVHLRGSSNGHVLIVHNDNGNIQFIDTQDGRANREVYFNPNVYKLITEKTYMKRIDNAKLNGEVIKYVVKAKENKYEELG